MAQAGTSTWTTEDWEGYHEAQKRHRRAWAMWKEATGLAEAEFYRKAIETSFKTLRTWESA